MTFTGGFGTGQIKCITVINFWAISYYLFVDESIYFMYLKYIN